MSIKIDLEKAYDRLNQKFITQRLQDCKFLGELINIIFNCISSSSFKILWNVDKLDNVMPSRGILQGDHPYHYLFCYMYKLFVAYYC